MTTDKFSIWLSEHHPKFVNLTDAVVLIVTQLLRDAEIPYLTITGRTKSIADCQSKSQRKNYKTPSTQLTDISGVRIIVYFEYDIEKVSTLIEENFAVDFKNSSNKDEILNVNEVGYRSVHYVCDLGEDRVRLKENNRLRGLKFEFQVRTVLQHAWAELAHDRNYKFSAQLPPALQRKLFLLAGLMETADTGFSDLSHEIDAYIQDVATSASRGNLDIELNSLSLEEFMSTWARENKVKLSYNYVKSGLNDLLDELDQFGIRKLQDLKNIIPNEFADKLGKQQTTILSIVRDWMILHDYRKFISTVDISWSLTPRDMALYSLFLSKEDLNVIEAAIQTIPEEDADWQRQDIEEQLLAAIPAHS